MVSSCSRKEVKGQELKDSKADRQTHGDKLGMYSLHCIVWPCQFTYLFSLRIIPTVFQAPVVLKDCAKI